MIFIPACRAAVRTLRVGATAARIMEMSIPARWNIPPSEPKSFCMSTTITAALSASIAIGPGLASIVKAHPGAVTSRESPAIHLLPMQTLAASESEWRTWISTMIAVVDPRYAPSATEPRDDLADNIFLRNESPMTAVGAVVAVVAHHEVIPLGYHGRTKIVMAAVLGQHEIVPQQYVVDVDAAVDDAERVAFLGDDPLDKRPRRVRGIVVHDDIPASRLADAIAKLVDNQPVLIFERRLHGVPLVSRDLEEERDDDHVEHDGKQKKWKGCGHANQQGAPHTRSIADGRRMSSNDKPDDKTDHAGEPDKRGPAKPLPMPPGRVVGDPCCHSQRKKTEHE